MVSVSKEKKIMSIGNIILIGIYIILTVSGLVLFKLGSSKDFAISLANSSFSMSINFIAIIGLCCYLCSFLLYMLLVSKFDLSYIVPITQGIVYVFIFLSSIGVFKEQVKLNGIIGTVLVILGIVLINIKPK